MVAIKGRSQDCRCRHVVLQDQPHHPHRHVPVVSPKPKVLVGVCSSAPLEVEASRLVVVSLLASPGIGDCEKVLLMSIM